MEHRATGEIGQRGFPEETYLRAEVCAPNTVSLCSMQLLEARFQPFRRKALGRSLPSWPCLGCKGQGQQGFFMPNQPSPQRRTRVELVSSCGDHQPSSSAHGARGSPDPPWPYGELRARWELGQRRDPEPIRIGAEVRSPSTVSFCRMQLLEGRLCRFGDRP